MATEPTATKRCPGIASLGIEPHELAATGENFSTNKSLPDGFATRCRPHDGLYGKAWLAAKRAGDTFSGKAGSEVPRSVRAVLAGERIGAVIAAGLEQALAPVASQPQEPATGDPSEPAAPPEAGGFPATRGPRAVRHPDGSEVFSGKAAQVAEREAGYYYDQLAQRAARGEAKGYTAETVGRVIYALPVGATASTHEGQVALQTVNEARSAERKRRDAERKRTERAAKKQAVPAPSTAN